MNEYGEADEAPDEAPGLDELHPPVPGGLVDTARKLRARHEAAAAEAAEAPARRHGRPVVVRQQGPDNFGAKTITIAAGQSTLGMPADPGRVLAIVNLVTTASAVLIARDRASADSGTGYLLESAAPALPLTHTREVWLQNPGGSSVQVSVLTESYTVT